MKLFKGNIEFKEGYRLNVKNTYLRVFDKDNNEVYSENSIGGWYKIEFDKNNNKVYFESSDGYWTKREYDKDGNEIYFEDSDGNIEDSRLDSSVTITILQSQLKKIKESGLL